VGASDDYYYSYLLERDYPGSYYTFTDILHLCKFSLRDGSLVSDTILSRTVHADTTTFGKWDRRDEIDQISDLSGYLADQGAKLVFPSRSFWYDNLVITSEGLFLSEGDARLELVGGATLRELLPPRNFRLVEQYRAGDYYLFLIASGSNCIDSDYSCRIIPVSVAAAEEIARPLRSRKYDMER
jgi:hypothetical protein